MEQLVGEMRTNRSKVVAIESDPYWQSILIEHISQTAHIELMALVADPTAAIQFSSITPIDILIIDIPTEKEPHFHLLEQLDPRIATIITTPFPHHATAAFEMGVSDLLLKPYGLVRFHRAINKANSDRRAGPIASINGTTDRMAISVRSGRRSIYLPIGEILWVEAIGNHVLVHTHDREVQANCTMKKMESMLPPDRFTRVHRSYIVADRIVKEIDRTTLFTTSCEIPIGTAYRKLVCRSFQDKVG